MDFKVGVATHNLIQSVREIYGADSGAVKQKPTVLSCGGMDLQALRHDPTMRRTLDSSRREFRRKFLAPFS